MKIYIQAKSKKAINEMVKEGKHVFGTWYNAFNPKGYETRHVLNECETGTTVVVYSEISMGSPVAKSWGTWDKEKNRLV